MLNFIFNVEHDWYCLHFRPGNLPFFRALMLPFKIFVNITCISLVITFPIAGLMMLAKYLDSVS